MADAPPLRIIGDGPLRSELEGLAEQLRVNARFVGGQGSDAVAAAMRASTALCVPSRTATNGDEEGLPMVVLEAAAHRLPLIAYTAGGIAEAVTDGETGLLLRATRRGLPGACKRCWATTSWRSGSAARPAGAWNRASRSMTAPRASRTSTTRCPRATR